MPRNITGDSPKSVQTQSVSMLPVAVVTQENLAEKAHPINDTTKSGKQVGGLVYVKLTDNSKVCIAIAQGSADTDKWLVLGMDTTGFIEVTPA
ncbi:hypothetical protein RCIP0089_00005 [Klebsiella phage RCIP0089]